MSLQCVDFTNDAYVTNRKGRKGRKGRKEEKYLTSDLGLLYIYWVWKYGQSESGNDCQFSFGSSS